MCVFGRPVRDLIPILPGKYYPHPTWKESLQLRETALRYRHMRHQDKWSEHTKTLSPLRVGDRVRIQNQTGRHPNKWDHTGVVIEVRQFHQYLIRIDGSGRQTLRNRKFLRKFVPVYQPPKRRSILEDIAYFPPTPTPDDTSKPPDSNKPPTSSLPSKPPNSGEDVMSPTTPVRTNMEINTPLLSPPHSPDPPTPIPSPPATSPDQPSRETLKPTTATPSPERPLRRSTRIKKNPDRFM